MTPINSLAQAKAKIRFKRNAYRPATQIRLAQSWRSPGAVLAQSWRSCLATQAYTVPGSRQYLAIQVLFHNDKE